MEGIIKQVDLHVVGYKHSGRFEEYPVLVRQAFGELQQNMNLIPSRTGTTVALYEPMTGVEGFFYVGFVVNDQPDSVPEGSEYIRVDGKYATAEGKIHQMGDIYDFVGNWIPENGHEQVYPDTLFVERYTFPISDQVSEDENVEVLLQVVE